MSYAIPSQPPTAPGIYSIGSRRQYRQYDVVNDDAGTPWVRTPIPGAGYRGLRPVMQDQPMALGSLAGAGDTATGLVQVVAGLLVDPERELARRGPALVSALDRHVVGPLTGEIIEEAQPYLIKYVTLPLGVIALASLAAAYFSYYADKNTRQDK